MVIPKHLMPRTFPLKTHEKYRLNPGPFPRHGFWIKLLNFHALRKQIKLHGTLENGLT